MTADLVAELREFATFGDNRNETLSGHILCGKAADEIERQDKQIERLSLLNVEYAGTIVRLSGALQMIAEGLCPSLVPPMTAEQIARAALDVPAEPQRFNHGPNCATFYCNPATGVRYECNCGAGTRGCDAKP